MIYYTVDMKKGYPVRFYDTETMRIGTFRGPFRDPGAASQEYKACCCAWAAEYLDSAAFDEMLRKVRARYRK
jgi:hypothetical protein